LRGLTSRWRNWPIYLNKVLEASSLESFVWHPDCLDGFGGLVNSMAAAIRRLGTISSPIVGSSRSLPVSPCRQMNAWPSLLMQGETCRQKPPTKRICESNPTVVYTQPEHRKNKEDHHDEVERMEVAALSTTSDSCVRNMFGIITGSCDQLTNDLLPEMPATIRAMRFA